MEGGEPVVQPATDYAPYRLGEEGACGWYALFASNLTHRFLCNGPIRKK
jgi:hypothetical protein